jgi:hypothetical protein
MGHEPGTGPAPQLGHAADMVGMPVRQQDGVHLADSMPGSSIALTTLSARPGSPVSTSTTPSSTTTA